jgi:hypothetical protein
MLKFFTGLSPISLIGMAAGALAVLAFVLLAFHWKHQASDRADKLATICTATRSAADNPKLGCGQVVVQISELGKSVATLKAGIASQNAAVNDLAAKSAASQAAAIEASRNAQARARGAEAASQRLRASSRVAVPLSASCEPSKAAKDAWR